MVRIKVWNGRDGQLGRGRHVSTTVARANIPGGRDARYTLTKHKSPQRRFSVENGPSVLAWTDDGEHLRDSTTSRAPQNEPQMIRARTAAGAFTNVTATSNTEQRFVRGRTRFVHRITEPHRGYSSETPQDGWATMTEYASRSKPADRRQGTLRSPPRSTKVRLRGGVETLRTADVTEKARRLGGGLVKNLFCIQHICCTQTILSG